MFRLIGGEPKNHNNEFMTIPSLVLLKVLEYVTITRVQDAYNDSIFIKYKLNWNFVVHIKQ